MGFPNSSKQGFPPRRLHDFMGLNDFSSLIFGQRDMIPFAVVLELLLLYLMPRVMSVFIVYYSQGSIIKKLFSVFRVNALLDNLQEKKYTARVLYLFGKRTVVCIKYTVSRCVYWRNCFWTTRLSTLMLNRSYFIFCVTSTNTDPIS